MAIAAACLMGGIVHAGNTWDGGGTTNNWTDGANWAPDGAATSGSGNSVNFAGSTRLSPVNDYGGYVAWSGVYFNSGAGSFNLTSSAGANWDLYWKIQNDSSSAQSVTIDAIAFKGTGAEFNPVAGNLVINAKNIYNNGVGLNVYGASGLVVDGTGGGGLQGSGGLNLKAVFSGSVTLAGPHGYTGVTLVEGGTLDVTGQLGTSGTPAGKFTTKGNSVTNWSGTGHLGGGSQYFGAGDGSDSTINVTAGSLTVVSGSTGVFLGTGSGGGHLNVSGGSFTMQASNNILVGGGGYNGSNNNGASSLSVSGTGLFDTGTTTGTFRVGSSTSGNTAGTGTVNLNGGTLATNRAISGGTVASSTFNFNGGTFKANGSSATLSGLTTANVRNGGARIDTNGHNVTIGQALVHSTVGGDNAIDGGLTKSNSGTLTLSNANTYTGTTTVSGGTLALSGAGALHDNGAVNVTGSSAVFDISAISASGETIGSLAGVAGASLVLGGKNLTAGGDNTTTSFAGVISGSGGSLTKTGAGTLTLSNANTYTGITTLAGGTLALSGGNNRLKSGNSVAFAGAATLDVGGTQQTLNGLTLLADGTTNTVKGSGGTLILQGSGDYGISTSVTGTSLNMAELTHFTFSRTSNTFSISANGTSVVNSVNLAKAGTNTIEATNVRFGGGGSNVAGQNSVIGLGQANSINAGSEFLVGFFQGSADVSFQSGLSNPSLTVRGSGGGSNPVPLFRVGQTNSGNQATTGILNLAGGSLDVIATEFDVATQNANANTNATGTVTMPAGTVVATTLSVSRKTSTSGVPTITGTLNQSGGTVTATTLYLGKNEGTTAANLVANYNLSGGTLHASAVSGQGATFGASTVRNLNLNGGTLRNYDPATDLTVSGVDNTAGGRINLVLGSSGGTIHADPDRTVSVNSNAMVSGSGTLTKNGAGTLSLGTSNSFTGAAIVSAGTLKLGHDSALGADTAAGTAKVTMGGGILDLGGYSPTVFGVDGSATGSSVTDSSGTPGTLTIKVNNFGTAAKFTGGLSLVIEDDGGTRNYQMFTSSLNDYTGTTTIRNGALLAITASNGLGGTTGGTTVRDGGALEVKGGADTSYAAEPLQIDGGGKLRTNSNFKHTWQGPVTLNGGAATIEVNSGAGQQLEISGLIDGSGGLTKTGSNILTLSANNTYTGATNINAGTLVVNGSQSSATGNVNVNAGATLKGNGTLGGAVTVDGTSGNKATHAPGASVGKQTIASDLSYGRYSIFEWELAGNTTSGRGTTGFDAVDVTGAGSDLTIDAAAVFKIVLNGAGSSVAFSDSTFWGTQKSWQVFSVAAGTITGDFVNFLVGNDSAGNPYTNYYPSGGFSFDGNTLSWTPVPEMSNLLAGGLLGAGLLRRRRRPRGGGER